MNVQFAIQNGVDLRARGQPARLAHRAVRLEGHRRADGQGRRARHDRPHAAPSSGLTQERVPKFFSVKEAVFPFSKFPDADPILGPEMKSTGEVMGTGRSFGEAYAKAQAASGVTLPTRGVCLISVRERDKPGAVELGKRLVGAGLRDRRDARHGRLRCSAAGIACRRANKVREGRPHIVDMIKNDEISLIVNTTEGKQAIRESHSIRREAVARKVTYYTTAGGRAGDLRGDRPPAGGRGQSPAGSSQGSLGMTRKPLTSKGAERLQDRAQASQDRRAAAHHPGDRRGARARRPERERRVSRRARAAGFLRGPHQGARARALALPDHRRLAPAEDRQGRLRRHRLARSRGRAKRSCSRSSAKPRPTCVSASFRSRRRSRGRWSGKSEGDEVDVAVPGGTRTFEIVTVRYV